MGTHWDGSGQSSTDVFKAAQSAPEKLLLVGQQLAEEVDVGRRARPPLLQPAQGVEQRPVPVLHQEGQRQRGAAAPAQAAVDQDAAGRLGPQRPVDEAGGQGQGLHQVLLGVVAQVQPQVA